MRYSGTSLWKSTGVLTAYEIDAAFRKYFSAGANHVKLPIWDPKVDFAQSIVDAGAFFSLNHDLLAGLISVESAWLQSAITREKLNPGGFGAENRDPFGLAVPFETLQEGIWEVAAHVAGYVYGDAAPRHSRRYYLVKERGWDGIVKTPNDLNGRYAYPGHGYGGNIASRTNTILAFAETLEGPIMGAAQIEGFIWTPAKSSHFYRGRTAKIRFGAQHYTAGTNSLGWLTGSSNPPVSAHLLVAHNPTFEARGHQCVALEDTAFTTLMANPYTVSTEYEHTGVGTIPDIAYDVMGKSWAQVDMYIRVHGLGELESIRGHNDLVGNPSLVCPDGISMERVNNSFREWQSKIAPVTDPNSEFFETGHWVINDGPVKMLDWYRNNGYVLEHGYPLGGMTRDEDGVYRQLFENSLLEAWPPGLFGGNSEWYIRRGGLGQRYAQLLAQMGLEDEGFA